MFDKMPTLFNPIANWADHIQTVLSFPFSLRVQFNVYRLSYLSFNTILHIDSGINFTPMSTPTELNTLSNEQLNFILQILLYSC